MSGSAYLAHANVQPLTFEDVATLDRNDVNAFDRPSTYNYDPTARTVSDALLYSSFLLTAVPFIDENLRSEAGGIALMYAETLLLTNGVTQLTKKLTLRARPYVYNEEVPIDEKLIKKARYSFFSGHISAVSSLSFLTANILHHQYKGRKFMPYIWTSAILLPATTAYFRVKSGKHFPTDVMAGYAAGALIGILVPNLHLLKKLERQGAKVYFGGNYLVINIEL
jgi:membrane-associated phospholipid phosphatase